MVSEFSVGDRVAMYVVGTVVEANDTLFAMQPDDGSGRWLAENDDELWVLVSPSPDDLSCEDAEP